MATSNFFKLLFLSFLCNVVFVQSETVPLETAEHHLIHQVIKNYRTCVRGFDGDKIFIRPENIVSTGGSIFINLNDYEFLPLPLLQLSGNGYFIEGCFMNGIELAAEQTKGPCPNCDVDTGKYGHCKNPNCEFYGLRVLGL